MTDDSSSRPPASDSIDRKTLVSDPESAEKRAMQRGELYRANDPTLVEERTVARELLQRFNQSSPREVALRTTILRQLFGRAAGALQIEPPFFCDYGYNISVGRNFYANANCVMLDVVGITLGDDVLLGPGVQLYAATHPLDPKVRASGLEYGAPINIGHRVWIGGGAIVCPGVTIGDETTIGAGSVVTRNIPAGVVAAGNPCRVIRPLDSKKIV